MGKIEIPRWTKVFFYMLEHSPKSSDHGKFVDIEMFDHIGFSNTLLKRAVRVPKKTVLPTLEIRKISTFLPTISET